MTRVQRRVMLFIQDRLDKTGKAPTYLEMSEALGYVGKSYLHKVVCVLEADGYLTRQMSRKHSKQRAFVVLRRIDPIVEYRVWDEQAQALVPFVRREAAA